MAYELKEHRTLQRSAGNTPVGGADSIRYAIGACTLGQILVAQSDTGICAILFGEDDESLTADLSRRFLNATLVADTDGLIETLAAAVRHVEAPGGDVDLPLDMGGTAFQRRVWLVLRSIPAGQTVSYADIAARVGAPKAVRAVAQACAANPLAVVVPCHRVVRADGGLSGYRWGTDRKRALLAREAGR